MRGTARTRTPSRSSASRTVAAWVLNRLARQHRRDVDLLLDAGHRLREAQAGALERLGEADLREGAEDRARGAQRLTREAEKLVQARGSAAATSSARSRSRCGRRRSRRPAGSSWRAGASPSRRGRRASTSSASSSGRPRRRRAHRRSSRRPSGPSVRHAPALRDAKERLRDVEGACGRLRRPPTGSRPRRKRREQRRKRAHGGSRGPSPRRRARGDVGRAPPEGALSSEGARLETGSPDCGEKSHFRAKGHLAPLDARD